VRALDQRLADAALRRTEAQSQAIAAEERLAALRAQIDSTTADRLRAQRALEATIIAAAFTERRLEPRAIRVGLIARAAAPDFAVASRRSGESLMTARASELQIAAEQIALADAQAAIDAEREQIAQLVEQRRTAQARLASDAAAAERRARTLAAEARTLRELAQRVQRRRGTAPAGASAIPAAWLAPVEGSMTRGFGASEAGGPSSQGALVRTRPAAQVLAPAAGEVAYAGLFRSYGQVLILNLDGGYALVLAGLDAVGVRVGETVRAGQPIGEMSASATPAPELYVEVRRGGQPVDPGRWLSARGLAAESGARAG
jgi:septal ring factor EnvC (AmiA/AmiB activator)